MRILLDTQIYLWFLADSSRLSKKARQHIENSRRSIRQCRIQMGSGH